MLSTPRRWSNTSTRNAWSQDTLALGSYAGQSVRIEFLARTDTSYQTSFFIDDVALQP